jgi:transposase
MEVSMIGLDLAKRVFQVHGVDEFGRKALSKRLRRGQVFEFFASLAPSVIGMEACATAHHWARELSALGHEVRLVPPTYVKKYVRRNKTDAADAQAICEAMRAPDMHFVPIKSTTQQSVLVLHRARELLVRQRTMTANALRGHLAEFGMIAPQGAAGLETLLASVRDPALSGLPEEARVALALLAEQWDALKDRIRALERRIVAWHNADDTSRRLATIPGVGPLSASALAASVGDAKVFKTGRHFAAWLGLTPREWSSGLRRRQGRITKRGDDYLRRLLVLGAHTVLRHNRAAGPKGDRRRPDRWLAAVQARRGTGRAAVALANKRARIAWAIMARGEVYRRSMAV